MADDTPTAAVQPAADQPLVTVVTPSFNQAEFLQATLRSVLGQSYPRIEYLVMDGGSDDGSREIIAAYGDQLAHWASEPDRGQAHAINKGLQRANGEIIGWLNSDDLYLPDTVAAAVAAFQRAPDVDVVYGRLERIDAAGRPVPTPLLPKDRLTFGRDNALGECIVNQPGSFWRRSIMETVGYLNEDLRYVLDYEYWVRMVMAGATFQRLERTMARFRLSQDSKTVGQTAQMAREHLAVIDAFLADPQTADSLVLSPSELTRQARHGRAVVCLYAAYGSLKAGERRAAARWWAQAHRYDPAIMLDRRWRDLARASLQRRTHRAELDSPA